MNICDNSYDSCPYESELAFRSIANMRATKDR